MSNQSGFMSFRHKNSQIFIRKETRFIWCHLLFKDSTCKLRRFFADKFNSKRFRKDDFNVLAPIWSSNLSFVHMYEQMNTTGNTAKTARTTKKISPNTNMMNEIAYQLTVRVRLPGIVWCSLTTVLHSLELICCAIIVYDFFLKKACFVIEII